MELKVTYRDVQPPMLELGSIGGRPFSIRFPNTTISLTAMITSVAGIDVGEFGAIGGLGAGGGGGQRHKLGRLYLPG